MSASKAMYQKLAKLAVVRGVNVQPNQPLVITASVRDYEFVRMVAKEAYAVGNYQLDGYGISKIKLYISK